MKGKSALILVALLSVANHVYANAGSNQPDVNIQPADEPVPAPAPAPTTDDDEEMD